MVDGHPLASAGAEDRLLPAASGAHEHAHVLDDAEHRDFDPLEHLEALARVGEGDVLGGGDDDRAAHRDALREGELDVPGAGRQVDDEIVHRAPVGVPQELLQSLGDHRPAPDHRGVLLDEVADGHGLDAMPRHRIDGALVRGVGPARYAEHPGLARAVDVRVQDADPGALGREGEGEVDRDGRLPHPALAGGDGDDVLDAVEQLDVLLDRVGDDLPLDLERGGCDARHRGEHRAEGGLELRGVTGRRESEDDADPGVAALEGDRPDRFPERCAEVRIHPLGEGAFDVLDGAGSHISPIFVVSSNNSANFRTWAPRRRGGAKTGDFRASGANGLKERVRAADGVVDASACALSKRLEGVRPATESATATAAGNR